MSYLVMCVACFGLQIVFSVDVIGKFTNGEP